MTPKRAAELRKRIHAFVPMQSNAPPLIRRTVELANAALDELIAAATATPPDAVSDPEAA